MSLWLWLLALLPLLAIVPAGGQRLLTITYIAVYGVRKRRLQGHGRSKVTHTARRSPLRSGWKHQPIGYPYDRKCVCSYDCKSQYMSGDRSGVTSYRLLTGNTSTPLMISGCRVLPKLHCNR